jgi:hypothetical protein
VSNQPEFDFDSPVSGGQPVTDASKPTGGGSSPQAGESIWREVPQARFLSWSPAMQASYCASRDLDSAESAHERGEDPEFYMRRAEAYAVEVLK